MTHLTPEDELSLILGNLASDVGVVVLRLKDLPAQYVHAYGLAQLVETTQELQDLARERLAETGVSPTAICSYDLLLGVKRDDLRVIALTDRARNSISFHWGDPDDDISLGMDVIEMISGGPYTMRVPMHLVERTRAYIGQAESLMWGKAADLVELVELDDGAGVVRVPEGDGVVVSAVMTTARTISSIEEVLDDGD